MSRSPARRLWRSGASPNPVQPCICRRMIPAPPNVWRIEDWPRSEKGCSPTRRREAVGALELSRHVALIGKSRLKRGIRKAAAGFHQPAHLVELPHGAKPAGAGAEGRAELARERPAVEIGHALQFIDRVSIGGTRGNARASAQQAGERKRRQRSGCIRTSAQKNIGDRGNNFDAPDVIDWDLHLPAGERASFCRLVRSMTGFDTKGSGLPPTA